MHVSACAHTHTHQLNTIDLKKKQGYSAFMGGFGERKVKEKMMLLYYNLIYL